MLVREHHAPVGALRPKIHIAKAGRPACQGAPRTCRCIETFRGRCTVIRSERQGAPRTCRCIETRTSPFRGAPPCGQGAPCTCRCIETGPPQQSGLRPRWVREHHALIGALRQEPGYREARRISSVVRTRLTERSWGHPPHRPVSSATPLSHCYASYPSATPLIPVQ